MVGAICPARELLVEHTNNGAMILFNDNNG